MPSTLVLFVAALALAAVVIPAHAEDPYQWLEEVEGEKALEWVEERSAEDTAELEAVPEFEPIHEEMLAIFNSKDRIPGIAIRGPWVYNFWRDADHVRGLWRRTFLDSYLTDDPAWETVIDVDALAEAEGENWVWKGAQGLEPEYRRFLVSLSRGGGDATVVREFDAVTKSWVDEGFVVPEAKSSVAWKDADAVWLGTDFGEGSLTESGYPRIVKLWRRGTELGDAETIFAGEPDDMAVGAFTMHSDGHGYHMVYRTPEFFRGDYYLMLDERLVKLDLPDDVQFQAIFQDHLLISLRSDWTVGGTTYPQDALLAIDLDRFLEGDRTFAVLFEPSERVSFDGVGRTRDLLLITTLDNVRTRLHEYRLDDGEWARQEVELPGLGAAGVSAATDQHNTYFVGYNGYLTPTSLFIKRPGEELAKVKTTPEFFDSAGMEVVQHEAESADGTMVPYFVVKPAGFEADGQNPTMLYGYGGFEVSMRPSYTASAGKGWIERGGVYVVANIRGGGEFGPKWHQAALKENRQRAFDDFIAVAEDLIDRGITSPEHLGIVGGSNGGLLVGAVMVQRPELFGAVVSQVPLLDMKRYHKLLAGASWMAEYGDPDTDDWRFMQEWSPYQNLDADADYPKAFIYTSTRDDRVHPGHARKMVKKMTDMGHAVFYYENTEGGHGMAANENQRAYMWALTFAYLWKMLR